MVMASLSVRNVPDSVVRLLRLRAARAGRSVEAEVRVLLQRATEGEGGERGELRGFGRKLLLEAGTSDTVDAFLEDRRAEGGKE